MPRKFNKAWLVAEIERLRKADIPAWRIGQLLGCSRYYIRDLVRQFGLPPMKIGRKRLLQAEGGFGLNECGDVRPKET